MLYQFYFNDSLILTDKIEPILALLNNIITIHFNQGNEINVKRINDQLEITFGENKTNVIKIVNLNNNSIFSHNDIHFMKYFLLSKEILDTQNNIGTPIRNPSELILNLFLCECMMSPYFIFQLFEINEDYIYQTFIMFLNKTVHTNKEIDENNKNESIILTSIIKDFFKNEIIYPKKYEKLFKFYLKQKHNYMDGQIAFVFV